MTATTQTDFPVLRAAYEQGHARQFVQLLEDIDWSNQPPEFFVEAINMALYVNATRLVHLLAAEGYRLHPDDEMMQRADRVFNPPRVGKTGSPAKKGINAYMRWFGEHAAAYRGKWVAVKAGELVAVADSRDELDAQIAEVEDMSDVVVSII